MPWSTAERLTDEDVPEPYHVLPLLHPAHDRTINIKDKNNLANGMAGSY
jgi:hypothetical protein